AKVVLVIPRTGPGARFETAPGWTVAVRKLLSSAVRISQVAGSEDGSRLVVEQLRRCHGAVQFPAIGDITCSDKNVDPATCRNACSCSGACFGSLCLQPIQNSPTTHASAATLLSITLSWYRLRGSGRAMKQLPGRRPPLRAKTQSSIGRR